ncbi:PfkB family carbohydrate kinase [Nocardioides pantholopis]|uniref:PfkB family carbohydrate kinase n=1 Tax=Nocardioides pantholopis TaxID=2483798 RepID=UPI000F0889E8|nr:PfkB family carbohydrate kinase [Nocardioides pantholopis]
MGAPVVVVGDALLDADLRGRAGRLAPDAPVPVVDRISEVLRPGGAALAAALAAADGHDVVLVSAVVADEDGQRLADLVAGSGVRLVPVPRVGSTPIKRRVLAGGQPVVRLDSGTDGRIGELPDEVGLALAGAGAVLVSDYGRGLVEVPAVRAALERAAIRAPLVWDPHPCGPAPVAGARVVTPNAAEAAALVPEPTGESLAAVAARAAALVARWRAHAVAVTLGSRGALLSQGGSSPSVIPAPPVRAADPCGAGDRFAAAIAGALASGAVTLEAVHAAVAAASAYVAAGGAAGLAREDRPAPGEPADPVERVRAAGGTVVATGGCFDLIHAGHVATLEAARSLGDCLVVCLNSDDSVRRLKGPQRPLVPAVDRARVLGALAPVDAVVVFEEDTPVEVLRRIRPDMWAKGGDYAGAELPEAALLREWGGQSVVLPYLDGRSTTGLVSAAAERSPLRPAP